MAAVSLPPGDRTEPTSAPPPASAARLALHRAGDAAALRNPQRRCPFQKDLRMALTKCPHCGQAGRVPDNFTGRQVKCPKCGEPFLVKAMPEAAASAPAQRPKAQAPAAPGGRTAPQRPAAAPAPSPPKAPERAPARPAKGPGGT